MQYSLVGGEDVSVLTAYINHEVYIADSTHPNWELILDGALASDESIVELFDISKTVATKFDSLSERVTVANSRLYFDGDEVNDVLSGQVIRFLEAGVSDWIPLVNFLENVSLNPEEHSREQLFTWLQTEDFTITPDGFIVGYKGVRPTGADGEFVSINRGRAIVDGEVKNGAIPNYIGARVTMPRSEVTWNPSVGCSQGLHVGTWDYAKSFSQGAVLEVHVNPRDVVSVPSDSKNQKMRVCDYTVVNVIDVPYSDPVLDWEDDEDWTDSEYWGEFGDDDYTGPTLF